MIIKIECCRCLLFGTYEGRKENKDICELKSYIPLPTYLPTYLAGDALHIRAWMVLL